MIAAKQQAKNGPTTSRPGDAEGTSRQERVGNLARKRACDAATHGEKSLELLRFPCDLCSDGSRKIDVAETDWPTTLRGEAAEIFTLMGARTAARRLWANRANRRVFRRNPGHVALTLTWNPREQAK